MLPVELQVPSEIAEGIADRARAMRISRGWTQVELARRAGVAVDTLRRFERTGKIALDRLLRIAFALGAARPFGELFAMPPARSLAELERMDELNALGRRARARRRRAEPS